MFPTLVKCRPTDYQIYGFRLAHSSVTFLKFDTWKLSRVVIVHAYNLYHIILCGIFPDDEVEPAPFPELVALNDSGVEHLLNLGGS